MEAAMNKIQTTTLKQLVTRLIELKLESKSKIELTSSQLIDKAIECLKLYCQLRYDLLTNETITSIERQVIKSFVKIALDLLAKKYNINMDTSVVATELYPVVCYLLIDSRTAIFTFCLNVLNAPKEFIIDSND